MDGSNPANGNELAYYDRLHQEKYRDENQSREEHCEVLANNLSDDINHFGRLNDSLKAFKFLPAGRVQAALGATEREVSPFNCAVSQKIEDNMDSIMDANTKAAKILRLGTGIGFNFSHLRPHLDMIKKLKTRTCGPVAFMNVFNATAQTIASAGHRRGALMGIMNVDHPDIEKFIDAKMEAGALRQFNISVGITDAFMHAVANNHMWPLQFNGRIYREVSAQYLWGKIIHNAYNSAEPGIIFIDRLNKNNNLYYCENIEATNPCAEQPLPPHGLCCLGSFNLPGYVFNNPQFNGEVDFDFDAFKQDVYDWVCAYDNIFDEAMYAIPEHREEALNKRRIGLGMTGIANAIELLIGRACYGEPDFCKGLDLIAKLLTETAYQASIDLAKKKGPFPAFDKDKYLKGEFIQTLPLHIRDQIASYGIRNSHLISYAPCGTISMIAQNVSSGVEPIFHHTAKRYVQMENGPETVILQDYNLRNYNFKGKTLGDCSVDDHMRVAEILQKYSDSAISKTVNVSPLCSYEEYEMIYQRAFDMGLKGITVYRPTELRGSIIVAAEEPEEETKVTDIMHDIARDAPLAIMSCANGACER